MSIRVNFSGTESFNFEAIPAGTYHAKITDGEHTETKNAGKLPAGTPGINWEFTIQDGEYESRKVWTNTWIHENTLGFLKGILEASGRFSQEQLDGDLEFDIDDVIGADVMVVVKARMYEGEMRNDVKRVKRYEGQSSATSSGSLLPS